MVLHFCLITGQQQIVLSNIDLSTVLRKKSKKESHVFNENNFTAEGVKEESAKRSMSNRALASIDVMIRTQK